MNNSKSEPMDQKYQKDMGFIGIEPGEREREPKYLTTEPLACDTLWYIICYL